MKQVKVCLPKGTPFYSSVNGFAEAIDKAVWTTVTVGDNATDMDIKIVAHDNIRKQVAREYLYSIKLWKKVDISFDHLEVVRQ